MPRKEIQAGHNLPRQKFLICKCMYDWLTKVMSCDFIYILVQIFHYINIRNGADIRLKRVLIFLNMDYLALFPKFELLVIHQAVSLYKRN